MVQWLSSKSGVDPSAKGDVAIYNAALHGHYNVVKYLLSLPLVNPSPAIIAACTEAHEDVVDLLLKCSRVDPTFAKNKALSRACAKGNLHIVKKLLKYPSVTSYNLTKPFNKAVMSGAVDIVKLFVEKFKFDPSKEKSTLVTACASGSAALVDYLLRDYRITPGSDCLQTAAEFGYKDIMQRLMEDSRINFQYDSNRALLLAAERGHLEMTDLLLSDSRMSKDADLSGPLLTAIRRGHTQVVKRFLKDPRVDPILKDRQAIYVAAKHNRDEILHLFLAKMDPKSLHVVEKRCYLIAATLGRPKIIRTLLQVSTPTCDIATAAALIATKSQFKEVVETLFDHPNIEIDVAQENQAIFKYVCWWGWTDLAAKLLRHPRCTISTYDNEPFALSCKGGHVALVKLLLADSRVDPTVHKKLGLRLSLAFPELLKVLIEDKRFHPISDIDFLFEEAIRTGQPKSAEILMTTGFTVTPTSQLVAVTSFLKKRYLHLPNLESLTNPKRTPEIYFVFVWRTGSSVGFG